MVVMDPLTDRMKLDIQYWQINPHGQVGVISGLFKFSAYMGDVNNRGLGFKFPNKAAIIKYPALSHTYRLRVLFPNSKKEAEKAIRAGDEIGNFTKCLTPISSSSATASSLSCQSSMSFFSTSHSECNPVLPTPGTILTFQPLSIMRHELAIMMTRNRNGDSTGVSTVIPYRSCIIDSNQAMLIALSRVKEIVKHGIWLSHGVAIPVSLVEDDRELYTKFNVWRKMFHEKVIGPASKMRGDFLVGLKRLPPPPGCNTRYDRWVFGAHSIARVISSGRHLLPRLGFNHVVKSFLKLGASLREIKVNTMGGRQDDLIPAAALFVYKSNFKN